MSSGNDHTPRQSLSDEDDDLHRAIISLEEELQAVDWYQQRILACSDSELRGILLHNKNEEIEHAMMLLDWLRGHHPAFAANIRTYLPMSNSLDRTHEDIADAIAKPSCGESATSLGISSLKGQK